MNDLVKWLREQIAETERLAHEARKFGPVWSADPSGYVPFYDEDDAASVLAQCEAHTAILNAYEPVSHYDNVDESYEHATGRAVGLGEAVRALALAYQHRPGYCEEWKS